MTSSYTVDDKSFEVMPSDRSLISANVDRFTDCEKDSVSSLELIECIERLFVDNIFIRYNIQETEVNITMTSKTQATLSDACTDNNSGNGLNQTFVANFHSQPPHDFRDTSSSSHNHSSSSSSEDANISCTDSASSSSSSHLITSHNIISISKNDTVCLPSGVTCMSATSENNSPDHVTLHGMSRLADIKKQLGLQSEFFLNQHEIVRA